MNGFDGKMVLLKMVGRTYPLNRKRQLLTKNWQRLYCTLTLDQGFTPKFQPTTTKALFLGFSWFNLRRENQLRYDFFRFPIDEKIEKSNRLSEAV